MEGQINKRKRSVANPLVVEFVQTKRSKPGDEKGTETNSGRPQDGVHASELKQTKDVLSSPIEQPRSYQREALEVALKQNTLVYLETGCGKTLISVLLMKEIGHNMRAEANNNVMIFLAPTVQLILQQARVIKINTGFKVTELHGDKGVDHWTSDDWNTQIKQHEVLVMTPQVLLDALSHAYVNLASVKLLIFDECHNAKGQHPYHRIMREYYEKCEKKPKIFGMTASPLIKAFAFSREDCEDQIAELEYTLDSKVYTSVDRSALAPYLPCPEQRTVYYDPPMFHYKELKDILVLLAEKHKRVSHEIHSLKPEFKDHGEYIKSLHRQLNSIHGNIQYCLDNLGLYCAFKAAQFYKNKNSLEFDNELDFQASESIQQCKNEFMEDVLQILYGSLPQGYEKCQWTDGECVYEVRNHLITQKTHTLLHCLSSTRISKQECCIVFVERVITAIIISNLISELDCLANISSDHLTGTTSMQESLSIKRKQGTLARFHSGEVNVLVTTNVAEEGIDVKNCSCIIQFDFPKNTNSFIQSQGRLRKPNSQYIIFTERSNLKEQEMLLNFIDSYKTLLEVVSNRSDRVFIPNISKQEDIDAYSVEETGATINSQSSVNFIYKYCSKLPGDIYYHPQPEFEYINDGEDELWKCILHLPANAPFQLAIGSASSRKKAKQRACLEACRNLHALGEIDDHLHQLLTEDASDNGIFDVKATKKLATGTTQRKELHATTKAKALAGNWLDERRDVLFYTYKVIFEGWESNTYQNLLLLTEAKLDMDASNVEIHLYLSRGRVTKAQVISNGLLSMSLSQVIGAKTFQEIVFNGMFGKLLQKEKSTKSIVSLKSIYETNEANKLWMPDNLYLLLPLEASSSDRFCIDWKSINQCTNVAKFFNTPHARSQTVSEDREGIHLASGLVMEKDLIDKAIIMIHSGKIYCVTNVLHDKTAESPFPTNDKTNYETYADYFQKKYGVKIHHTHQPLLQLKQSHRAHNLLRRFEKAGEQGELEVNMPCYIEVPAELCLNLELSHSMIRTLYLIPSVMYRLTTLILASQLQQEIQKNSNCPTIPANLVMQALTTSRCLETFSMESLELLGDSVLKYAVSCHLFVKYKNRHEGYLSIQRSQAVCNATLHHLATEHNLPGYIRDEPFDPLRWVAPGTICSRVVQCRCKEMGKECFEDGEMVVKIGKACDEGHRWMCSKTISDCAEALIGAYMVSGGLNGAYEFMKWMNVDVSLEPAALRFPSIHPNILHKADLIGLESLLRYNFHNKYLLVEAITHASKQDLEGRFCYQRLEFLGDAALDLLITRHLYFENTNLTPGCLTDLRSAAVNNQAFANAAVKHGLQKYIRHSSGVLLEQITEFVQYMEHENSPPSQAEVDAPKVLGDIVESIAGAILVDACFNLEKVWEIMKPLLSPIVTPMTMHLDPVREVCEICHSHGFSWKWMEDTCEDKRTLLMEVSLSDCSVILGKSAKLKRKYAKKEAAQQILKKMEKKGIYHPYRQKVEQSNVISVQNAYDKSYSDEDSRCNAETVDALHPFRQTGDHTYRNCNSNAAADERDAHVIEGSVIRSIPNNNMDATSNSHQEMEMADNETNIDDLLTENVQPIEMAESHAVITTARSDRKEGLADPINTHQNQATRAFISVGMGKGEARKSLYEHCKKLSLPNPRFKEEQTRPKPARFVCHVNMQISTGESISVSGDQKLDKKSARDSAAMKMLMELAKRGLCMLKPKC